MPTGNYDEALVPKYVLPDPLKMADGSEVKTAEQWLTRRRGELLELFCANDVRAGAAAAAGDG